TIVLTVTTAHCQLKKAALRGSLFLYICLWCESVNGLHHSAHAASGSCRGFFFFRDFRHDSFGRQQQAGDRSSVLEREARYLGRVDNTSIEEVFELVFAGIVTVVFLAFANLADDNRSFLTSIGNDGAQRSFESQTDDVDTSSLVVVVNFNILEGFDSADISNTTTRDDTFLNSSACCVQRIVKDRKSTRLNSSHV